MDIIGLSLNPNDRTTTHHGVVLETKIMLDSIDRKLLGSLAMTNGMSEAWLAMNSQLDRVHERLQKLQRAGYVKPMQTPGYWEATSAGRALGLRRTSYGAYTVREKALDSPPNDRTATHHGVVLEAKATKDDLDVVMQMIHQTGNYLVERKGARQVVVSNKSGAPLSVMQLMRDVSRMGFGSDDFDFARDGKGNAIVTLKAIGVGDPDMDRILSFIDDSGGTVDNGMLLDVGLSAYRLKVALDGLERRGLVVGSGGKWRLTPRAQSKALADEAKWTPALDAVDVSIVQALLDLGDGASPDAVQRKASFGNKLIDRNEFSPRLQRLIRMGYMTNSHGSLSITPDGEAFARSGLRAASLKALSYNHLQVLRTLEDYNSGTTWQVLEHDSDVPSSSFQYIMRDLLNGGYVRNTGGRIDITDQGEAVLSQALGSQHALTLADLVLSQLSLKRAYQGWWVLAEQLNIEHVPFEDIAQALGYQGFAHLSTTVSPAQVYAKRQGLLLNQLQKNSSVARNMDRAQLGALLSELNY